MSSCKASILLTSSLTEINACPGLSTVLMLFATCIEIVKQGFSILRTEYKSSCDYQFMYNNLILTTYTIISSASYKMAWLLTSPRTVFSMRAFTIRAAFKSLSDTSFAVIIGVLIFLAALIISLIRGTPRVTSFKYCQGKKCRQKETLLMKKSYQCIKYPKVLKSSYISPSGRHWKIPIPSTTIIL